MNVLTITQSFVLGGLESRIHGDFKWAGEHGIGTYLATSGECFKESLPPASLGITTGLDICDTMPPVALLHTIERLMDIVNRYQIDVIHAHPFAALWPGFLVSQLSRKPLVVSLHGPASLSPAQRGIQWRMQMAFVLTHASLLACVSRETEELVRTLVCHDRIRVFPNSVDTNIFHENSRKSAGRWALISRLDHDKKEGVVAFFEMLVDLPISQLDVVGDGECRAELERLACGSRLKEKGVRFLGACRSIEHVMNEYDGIVGMGRVVLEAMAKALPVILLGYDGVKGGINEELLGKAAYSNFSGRGLENIMPEELQRWLETGVNLFNSESLKKIIHERFGDERLWQDFYAEINNLQFVKCTILEDILSIFGRNIANTISYCENELILHEMELLLDKVERIYLCEACSSSGKKDFMDTMAMTRGWRLGAIAEHNTQCRSSIYLRDKEIERLKGSASWRLTRPLRGVYWVFNKIFRAFLKKHRHH